MLNTITSGGCRVRRSESYRHSSALPRFQITSLGDSPTCGRPTPAMYLTPLRARNSDRSASRLTDSIRPGAGTAGLGIDARAARGARLGGSPVRLRRDLLGSPTRVLGLLESLRHVAQAGLDRGE